MPEVFLLKIFKSDKFIEDKTEGSKVNMALVKHAYYFKQKKSTKTCNSEMLSFSNARNTEMNKTNLK